VDDVHFLAPSHADANAVKMANHLKFLANTFPVTLIYVGVGVAGRGLLTEGRRRSRRCMPSSGGGPRC